jgi:NAD(P)-dependent dehydrogenase (short-subunit alcohol dehydrogenase family)
MCRGPPQHWPPSPGVEVEAMDLLDPGSIDAFAERFGADAQPLHLLVNNAGIMACPFTRDGRGFEHQFATNHLGHFQLTARLWPALRRANGARVISVSSRGHWFSPVDFDVPNFEHRAYDPWLAYGQSKTANILFAVSDAALADRVTASSGWRDKIRLDDLVRRFFLKKTNSPREVVSDPKAPTSEWK